MWNRLKAILADFIQQADLVLLNPDLTLDSVYVDGEKVR